jgi:glycosyltransferase involved in cell wall biosynthesis
MNKKCPEVSVVMPVYRCEKYIKESIESILGQTFRDFELIIISDDSTPEMKNILAGFQNSDSRVVAIHQDRKGYFFSRNQCCKIARGTFIAVMDCDDISYLGRLATQVQFLKENPDIGAVGSWYKVIDKSGIVSGKFYFPVSPMVVRWTLLFGNSIGHGTIMMRRQILENVGFYNSGDAGFCEDYDLWVRLLKNTNIANIPKFLLKYRIHHESISQKQQQLLYSSAIEISRSQIVELLKETVENDYIAKLYTMKNINTINDVEKLIKLLEKLVSVFLQTFPCSSEEKNQIKMDASRRIAYICLVSAKSTHLKSLLYLKSGIKLNPWFLCYLPFKILSRILNRSG